ncbi:hypothetical protein ACQPX6_10255 [Actinomycetospora sp. CA-101289]|uniref:hypothetical protein n=1 Tax=Actinomycetospora sp. CA-101289 TaxID=3239893 RepID=UPI003D96C3D7
MPDELLVHDWRAWPPEHDPPAGWSFGDQEWLRVAGFPSWRRARRAWLLEHAPGVSHRDVVAEQRRRFPIVHPV